MNVRRVAGVVLTIAISLAGASGCGEAIAGGQADGKDCNYGLSKDACGAASFCDPGKADSNGTFPRVHQYADKAHPVGTCRPKVASGAACEGNEHCTSNVCLHELAGGPGKCQ